MAQPQLTTWDGLPVSNERPYGATIVVQRVRAGLTEWLVLHRAHHGPDYSGDWAWTPPAGARLPGEPIGACARRELREETGLELEPELTSCGSDDWAVFVAKAPPDADVRLDEEHDAFAWLPLEAACERCAPERVAATLRAAAGYFSGI